MRKVSNDELTCEVIRRVRGRMLPTGGYEGAKVRSVLEALRPLMSNAEITFSFQRLLTTETIVVLGTLREHNPDKLRPKDSWFAQGVVRSLHPDIVLRRESCYFSPAGSLLREARRNGRLIEPSHKSRYIWFHLGMCYVTADGLPHKVTLMLHHPPLPQPVLPEFV